MATVVLDSSNLKAVLADANGEVIEAPKTEAKTEEKKEEAAEAKKKEGDDEHVDPEDVEGDDGLTAKQKKELSATMLKTIGKKHRQMKEAEEFAAAQYSERKLAEDRAAHLQAQLDAVKGKQVETKKEEIKKPVRQDYATESEYIDASIQYGVDEGLRKKAEADAQDAVQRAYDEMLATAKGRIAKAIEIVPDFADVTGAADIEVPPAVAGYMQESEMFAELGYYLAKNPDVVVSLAKLTPRHQLVKIVKIETTLQPFSKTTEKTKDDDKSSKAVTETSKVSDMTGLSPSKARNTAPVIQPLSTIGSTVEKDPVDMNIRETISDWQKRNNANLAMRKRH